MFTDKELANQMAHLLVANDVMSKDQLDQLLDEDTTENAVRDALSPTQLDNFATYWSALAGWMSINGGDITTTSGNGVPGRQGGNPTGLTLKPLYNDAFRDVRAYVDSDDFKPVKAVSNHLRFISVVRDM